MSEYRVNLPVYNGPMDLLLYLIRRDEVDIHDIPIARITEQYLSYVDLLKALDPNLAGDFLVMAATLMEIKTRMLLPAPEQDAEDGEPVDIDPRAELVRQLLEYKKFKDAAEDLREAGEQQAMRFGRRPAVPEEVAERDYDLEDVQVWDLLDAFDRLMKSIGQQPRQHEVIYDDTPIELHAADIRDRLEHEGALPFTRIFEGRTSRVEVVGLFLALLELMRRKEILVSQEGNFSEIHIHLNPNPPGSEPEEAEQPTAGGPGEYVSQPAPTDNDASDRTPETDEDDDEYPPDDSGVGV
ncbi:MAG: segregation and condensation protein A [Phycisphaerae bacterium]